MDPATELSDEFLDVLGATDHPRGRQRFVRRE